MKHYRTHLLVCAGTGCVSCGSFKIKEALEKEVKKRNLQDEVQVVATGCNGFCERGPIVMVQPDGIFYQLLKIEDVPHLVEEHLLKGRPVKKLMYVPPAEKRPVPKMKDIEFFKHQRLIVLRNRGRIDPEKVEEYIAFDGYEAMAKALSEMTPAAIIDEILFSGLRGRGGAGFPTGKKWAACAKDKRSPKYLICNGDEGDPGAFMDRSVLEADPHAVIEGMVIGAKAIGASKGFIYIRHEYPLALKRVEIAIAQARENGLLGEDILGTGFDFDLEIVQGAGAFVSGEETALIASVEGKIAMPRQRPPFPAQKGLWGQPTVINNVETWATVPNIIRRGSEWFSSLGTETSKGTKIFSLVGKINNTGLVEVPMGITLRDIVYGIGGGIPDNHEFKAVQIGGPSGGCLPAKLLDLPVDYESLTAAGAMMGSGGMIVMDDKTCMVDIAKYFLNFLQDESCGKCVSCREGTQRMYEIVKDITEGKGKEGDLALLEELAQITKDASLCGLGQTAGNPVLTTLRYFRHEYEAHILDKRCPAGVCAKLIRYVVLAEKCTGCLSCKKACPTEAIQGSLKEVHSIIQSKCIKCGACREACRFEAIEQQREEAIQII
ncbi:MAG: NADH-ubiquinone oxidoreductase-F iron-sulfur binding region domain-containing protein [Candidatus Aminicenantales bacterium]